MPKKNILVTYQLSQGFSFQDFCNACSKVLSHCIFFTSFITVKFCPINGLLLEPSVIQGIYMFIPSEYNYRNAHLEWEPYTQKIFQLI